MAEAGAQGNKLPAGGMGDGAGDIEEGLSRLLDLDPSERDGHPMHVFVRTGKRRHGWMDWMPFPLHAVRCPTVSAPHDSGALLDSHGL